LAELDIDMAQAFKESMNDANPDRQKTLQKSQRDWLRSRDNNCAPSGEGDDVTDKMVSCLTNSYHDRLSEMASQQ
jgi:uncharacterized protein YecT (DUF1311 family)